MSAIDKMTIGKFGLRKCPYQDEKCFYHSDPNTKMDLDWGHGYKKLYPDIRCVKNHLWRQQCFKDHGEKTPFFFFLIT